MKKKIFEYIQECLICQFERESRKTGLKKSRLFRENMKTDIHGSHYQITKNKRKELYLDNTEPILRNDLS